LAKAHVTCELTEGSMCEEGQGKGLWTG